MIRDRDLLGRRGDDYRRLVWPRILVKRETVKFESIVGDDRVCANGRAADGVKESFVNSAVEERPGVRQGERTVKGYPPVIGHVVGFGRAERRSVNRIDATEDQPENISRHATGDRADGV